MCLNFSEDCDNSPDLGQNSGIASHNWDGSVSEDTEITYFCKEGNAFQNVWTQSTTNKCTQHGSDSSVSWKYKSSSPLPNCIRKFI